MQATDKVEALSDYLQVDIEDIGEMGHDYFLVDDAIYVVLDLPHGITDYKFAVFSIT